MRFGCNFWLEDPIDLKPTRLNCILALPDLFRAPTWPYLAPPNTRQNMPNLAKYAYFVPSQASHAWNFKVVLNQVGSCSIMSKNLWQPTISVPSHCMTVLPQPYFGHYIGGGDIMHSVCWGVWWGIEAIMVTPPHPPPTQCWADHSPGRVPPSHSIHNSPQ